MWCVVCVGCGVCVCVCVCVCVVCLCVCVFVCVGLTLPKLSLEASFKFDPPLQWGATARGMGLAVDKNRLLLTSHGHLWGSEGGHRPGPPGNHNFCQQPRGWGLAVAKGGCNGQGGGFAVDKNLLFLTSRGHPWGREEHRVRVSVRLIPQLAVRKLWEVKFEGCLKQKLR